ncbi:MAG: shikimate kinase [Planctomycetes bacterium]|nr:shikimate kinase [Planctomycetota bacterium]
MSFEGTNVVLVGMRASGKTSLGRRLSERLGRPFVDLDDELAARVGLPVDEALRSLGEPAFRELERELLRQAAERRDSVIATGGGAVLGGDAFAALAAAGVVVWLQVEVDELVRRGSARPRPPLTPLSPEAEVRRLLAEREPLYRAAADIAIPAGGPDPILDLLSRLPPRIRG